MVPYWFKIQMVQILNYIIWTLIFSVKWNMSFLTFRPKIVFFLHFERQSNDWMSQQKIVILDRKKERLFLIIFFFFWLHNGHTHLSPRSSCPPCNISWNVVVNSSLPTPPIIKIVFLHYGPSIAGLTSLARPGGT